jgi:hypothetical protein
MVLDNPVSEEFPQTIRSKGGPRSGRREGELDSGLNTAVGPR